MNDQCLAATICHYAMCEENRQCPLLCTVAMMEILSKQRPVIVFVRKKWKKIAGIRWRPRNFR